MICQVASPAGVKLADLADALGESSEATIARARDAGVLVLSADSEITLAQAARLAGVPEDIASSDRVLSSPLHAQRLAALLRRDDPVPATDRGPPINRALFAAPFLVGIAAGVTLGCLVPAHEVQLSAITIGLLSYVCYVWSLHRVELRVSTDAVITAVETVSDGEGYQAVRFQYTYDVEGRVLRSHDQTRWSRGMSDHIEQLRRRFSPGTVVRVHYHPDDPRAVSYGFSVRAARVIAIASALTLAGSMALLSWYLVAALV
jgi:hypothetical protein